MSITFFIVLLLFFTRNEKFQCAYEIECLNCDGQEYTVSEVPHWDEDSQSLYFINIADANSTINRYDYACNRFYSAHIDNTPVLLFIIPTDCGPDKFLVGINNEAVLAQWDGISPKAHILKRNIFTLDPGTVNLINDVKTDQCGRFFCGTKR